MRPPDTASDSEILPGPLSHLSSCMLMITFSHRKSVGLSGRTLRKIPFLAHALYIHVCMSVIITTCTTFFHLDQVRESGVLSVSSREGSG